MSIEFFRRAAIHVLLCLVSSGQGAMVNNMEDPPDNHKPNSDGFCKLPPILHIPTKDEMYLDIPKANCETEADQKMLEDGGLLSCRLDPTGNKQVPKIKGYALQGGVYRQVQSMLDKEFIVYCCEGKLSFEACFESQSASEKIEELFVSDHNLNKCPESRYWTYYDHVGTTAPRNKIEWESVHSHLTNTSIQASCVKISKLKKSKGYSDRVLESPVCGDEDMEIRFDKDSRGNYHPYLVYKKKEGWYYWLRTPERIGHPLKKAHGVRVVGCCTWELDGFNVAGSKATTHFAKRDDGHSSKVSGHLLTWTAPQQAIRVETCDDF